MYRLILLYLLTLLLIGCQGAGDEKKPMTPADSLKAAIAGLDKEIAASKEDPLLYARRAELYLADRQPERALGDINQAISLDPRQPSFYILLSDVYLLMGQPQQCGQSLERALSIDPANKEALLKRAKYFLILLDYPKTFETLKTLLDLDPVNPPAYYLRAIALLENGDTARAVGDLMKAVDQDQEFFDAYMQLGELFALRKDALAESYFKNALNIRPQSKEALYMLGMFYQETGQYDKAITVYQQLSGADSTIATAPYNIGYIYLVYLKDFSMAESFFTKAIMKDSGYFEAWYNRGYCFELMNDHRKAESDYKKALKIEVNYPRAIEGLNRLDKLKSGS